MAEMAVQPDFDLGVLSVSPSRRRVAGPGGVAHLEPRVMSVFLLLLDMRGRVVTRAEIFDQCWGGDMVGDDSLNRAIGSIRRLAANIAPGAFEIETVPRTGYRLTGDLLGESGGRDDSANEAAPAPAGSGPKRLVRHGAWAAGAAALAAAVLIAAVPQWTGRDSAATLAVVAERNAALLSPGLTVDLAELMSGNAGRLVILEKSAARADYRAQLSTEPVGDRLRVHLSLLDSRSSQLLWSGSLEQHSGGVAQLRRQVAARLAHVLSCAVRSGAARQLDVGALRLYLANCDAVDRNADERRLAALREITRLAPQFAQGWAELAAVEAILGQAIPFPSGEDNPQRRALRAAAREHLERARALNPRLAAIYLAEAELLGVNRWAEQLVVQERGLAAEPSDAALHGSYALTLQAVGRMMEAVTSARRAVSLDPASPVHRANLANSLAYAGQLAQARGELERLEAMWPDSPATVAALFRFHLRFGDPAIAAGMIEAGQVDETPLIGRDFLGVRSDPSPAKLAALVQLGQNYAERRPNGLASNLQMLGQFGRVDEAYRLLQSPRTVPYLRHITDVLFRPHMRAVRLDPRFMTLAEQVGLLGYWSASNRWPDFCRDPALPYDCRAEARRLLDDRVSAT